MMKKKIMLMMSLLAIAISLSACHIKSKKQLIEHPDTWNKIEKSKKVVIGIDDSFVPMDFQQPNGKVVGYDVDLARKVFDQYGIQVDFQPIDWSMNITELNNGTIDLIWNGFTINKQREKKILFSEPYLKNSQVLVTKKSSNIRQVSQMKNKQLGVQTGSAGQMDLDQHPKVLKNFIKDKDPILYDTFNDAFIDLDADRISGLLIDQVYADYYIKKLQTDNVKYRVLNIPFDSDYYGVGMKKHDTELKNKINHGLNKLSQDGEIKKLNQKWLGHK